MSLGNIKSFKNGSSICPHMCFIAILSHERLEFLGHQGLDFVIICSASCVTSYTQVHVPFLTTSNQFN